jgi:CBS domain-containing protein
MIMTREVASCGPETNLASVVETMWMRDCGIVPVVNERGEAVGVVTDRDICIALGTRDVPASSLVARNAMTAPVVGCAPEDDAVDVLLTMAQRHVRRVPVLGIGGVLLGIVSIDDIVRQAARAPESDPLRTVVLQIVADVDTPARPAPKALVVGA